MKTFFVVAALLFAAPSFSQAEGLRGLPFFGPIFGRPAVECVAVNGRGFRFVGRGIFLQGAAQKALNQCYRIGSVRCVVRGCYSVRGL